MSGRGAMLGLTGEAPGPGPGGPPYGDDWRLETGLPRPLNGEVAANVRTALGPEGGWNYELINPSSLAGDGIQLNFSLSEYKVRIVEPRGYQAELAPAAGLGSQIWAEMWWDSSDIASSTNNFGMVCGFTDVDNALRVSINNTGGRFRVYKTIGGVDTSFGNDFPQQSDYLRLELDTTTGVWGLFDSTRTVNSGTDAELIGLGNRCGWLNRNQTTTVTETAYKKYWRCGNQPWSDGGYLP